ncbi:hypothetical protein [Miltoncostaea oceani]|uniref:hypothetical protein n=1 Tax=Miltoncostaea oceani TaxID=2843216 RepID=UPI001C3C8EC3|nr:hypothetical protein [Miltoncostaea oceani]
MASLVAAAQLLCALGLISFAIAACLGRHTMLAGYLLRALSTSAGGATLLRVLWQERIATRYRRRRNARSRARRARQARDEDPPADAPASRRQAWRTRPEAEAGADPPSREE